MFSINKNLIIFLIFISISIAGFCNTNIDLLINLVQFYINNGDYDSALSQIEKGLEINSEHKELNELKVDVMKKIQEKKQSSAVDKPVTPVREEKITDVNKLLPEKKLKPFKFLTEIEKEKIDELVNEGVRLRSLGRNSEAVEKFNEALKYDDLNEDANLNLGILLYNMRKIEEAKKKFETVLMYNSENYSAMYWLGLVNLRMRNIGQAKALLTEVTKKDGRNILSFLQLASIYEAERNVGLAERYYREALKADSRLINIYQSLANMYFKNVMYAKAVEVYREIISRYPQDPSGYMGIAFIHLLEGNFESAVHMHSSAKNISSEHSEVKAFEALLSYFSGNQRTAAELLDKVLEQEPDNLKIYRVAVDILGKGTDNSSFEKYSKKALEKFPMDGVINLLVGRNLFNKRNYESAMEYFERVIAVFPDNLEALYGLAKSYGEGNYFSDSLKKYRTLIEKFPQDPKVETWNAEARQIYEKYRTSREIEVVRPESSTGENSTFDYSIPYGF